jgi:putative ABC transport system permease protein
MTVLRDTRFGIRLLKRNPGFTVVAVVTLALGIAATTAIFSVVYGTFFAPLPYRDADALVMTWSQFRGERVSVAPRDFVEWKRRTTVFSDLNAWGGRGVNLAANDRPENMRAGLSTPGFLGMMGYGHPLALGRTFTEEEGTPGKDRVAILTYRVWHERFAGDSNIVGRPIRLDGEPYTVVGVLGDGPADHQQNKLWLPLAFTPEQLARDGNRLNVMGRLKPGITLAQANANLNAVVETVERERPEPRTGWRASVEPFRNNFVRDSTKRGLWLLLGAVAFLLLIACANVANLLLARGTARHRELAVRTSMGATPGALVRQLLTESLVVAAAGGALGSLGALVLIDAIVALMPDYTLPSETEIVLSVPVLVFAFAVCVLAGTLAGCAPAWQASRANPGETLKEGSRSVTGGRNTLRRALVVAEFALALTLLAGGGMAVHALIRMMNTELGFRTDRLLTFNLPVSSGRLTTPEQAEAFYRQLLDRTAAVTGVVSAAASTGMPVRGTSFGRNFEIVGRPLADPTDLPGAGVNMVTPAYFDTFGIRMVRGRAFTERDRAGSLPVAVVNEAFVKRYLADVNPLDVRLRMRPFTIGQVGPSPPREWQIVGVYGNVRNAGPGQDSFPEIDVPFWQVPWQRATVAVHTTGDAASVQQSLAAIVASLDPELPMAEVRTIQQVVSESMADDRFYTVFFGLFAAVALVLAAVGIYGVMSFVVAQRTHEIGLRMALGAGRGQVVSQIVREGMATALAGTALGAAGAYVLGRAMKGTVFGVDSADPLVFVGVALTLLGAALLACLVPARRAASVDPMVALRQDQ